MCRLPGETPVLSQMCYCVSVQHELHKELPTTVNVCIYPLGRVLITRTDGSSYKPPVSCNDSRVSVIISPPQSPHHTGLRTAFTSTADHWHPPHQTGQSLSSPSACSYSFSECLLTLPVFIFHFNVLPQGVVGSLLHY